jgi:hypothetical protein
MSLRKNQIDAIKETENNDFSSGIHYHATGSGKSWIAIHILGKYNKTYPDKNVLWICERKDILVQQFSRHILKERSFDKILQNFIVVDIVEKKNDKWFDSCNASRFWGKPFLCIVNRCFLTSKDRYKNIKSNIDLVIHDECHSIENKTTQDFYQWLLSSNNPNCRIIGFSATPELIYPLNNIVTQYSIYDAFLDNVILPPRIVWVKSEQPNIEIDVVKRYIKDLPYQKLIVWCGMIDECIQLATKWSDYFPGFDLCIDFNDTQKLKNISKSEIGFKDFRHFYNTKCKSLLFCAVKHREGSDIPYLDGCIFMDLVEKRGERVFIQCMGRVLRKDKEGKKKYGLVLDFKAKSTIQICNRVQYYLKLPDIFPWKYQINTDMVNGKQFFINQLDMTRGTKCAIENISESEEIIYTRDDIYRHFKRKIPDNPIYQERLAKEIELILSKRLFENMIKALDILEITKNIPHITRGSCGSSLVCYLLGISHVDPVKHNISFARFINQYRDSLPDIDFDFPHYLRDEVFLKLFMKWGNKVARISNHNYFHEKSALRESLRKHGVHKFISKYEINKEIKSYSDEFREEILKTQKDLEGTFKGYSLHCGGIIYFPKGIPEDYKLDNNNQSILPQVKLNKHDVSDKKSFKIDILSSRGLSQLYYCHRFNTIDFNINIGDKKTIELLSSGNNIGITLAETPLMRKALMMIKPQNINDLAICLSIIRPAACDAKKEFQLNNFNSEHIIFDDDIIQVLSKLGGCDEDQADKLRRGYCKNKKESLDTIDSFMKDKTKKDQNKVHKILSNLRKYGFCKAHAYSYAQLVWQLAYQKAHFPKRFWKATLKNVKSCYRKWVHLYEARQVGLSVHKNSSNKSIYAQNRDKKLDSNYYQNALEQLKQCGYWRMSGDFFPGCYFEEIDEKILLKGVIASSRSLNYGKNKKLLLYVCINGKYIDVIVNGKIYYDHRKVVIKASGNKIKGQYTTIDAINRDVTFY